MEPSSLLNSPCTYCLTLEPQGLLARYEHSSFFLVYICLLVFVREREMLYVRMRDHVIIYTDPSQKRFIRYLNLVVITWRRLRIRILRYRRDQIWRP